MASKGQREAAGIPPTKYPEIPPAQALPSGDFSYNIEAVMQVQKTLGELTQAVKTLTEEIKEQKSDLKMVSKDVHTWKVTIRVVGLILAGAVAFAGWAISKVVDVYVISHPPTTTNQLPAGKNN
jgi:hypothetical protein